MILIFEGPDGVGKTTAARVLEKEHGFQYRHCGVPKPGYDALRHYADQFLDAYRSGQNVVFDRLHLGEMTYGPVKRNEDRLTNWGRVLMDRLINSRSGWTGIFLTDLQACVKNWEEKLAQKDDYLQDRQLLIDVYFRYSALTAYYSRFDYRKDRIEDILKLAVTRSLPASVIGSFQARFLVIGERPANDLDLPFFGFCNSSGFLNRALWDAGFQEHELAFMNTYDVCGVMNDVDAAIKALPNLRTILAFGRFADRWESLADDHQINFCSFRHPQYMKRFEHSLRHEFVFDLKKVRRDTLSCSHTQEE